MRARFGDFVLDTDTRELRRGSQPIHLSPKAFQLLQLLVEARPKALSKTDLQQRLWPDTFVVEANLSNLIGEVRGALGEAAHRPQFVRTLHGFGYAFHDAPAAASHPQTRSSGVLYRLAWQDGQATLEEGDYVLGRDSALAVFLDSPSVSRRHAWLRLAGSEVILEDLGSKNGTYLNGRKVTSPVRVSDRDEIRVGRVLLAIRVLAAQPSTETTG
jgi:DNA-binding winged helix-turn-helix (wHTH) protein